MARRIEGVLYPSSHSHKKADERAVPVYCSGPVTEGAAYRQAIMAEMATWKRSDETRPELLDPSSIDPDGVLDPLTRIERNYEMVHTAQVIIAMPPVHRASPGTWGEMFLAIYLGKPVIVLWAGRMHTWLFHPALNVCTTTEELLSTAYRLIMGGQPPEAAVRRWEQLPEAPQEATDGE